jgi:hypothetical protein
MLLVEVLKFLEEEKFVKLNRESFGIFIMEQFIS